MRIKRKEKDFFPKSEKCSGENKDFQRGEIYSALINNDLKRDWNQRTWLFSLHTLCVHKILQCIVKKLFVKHANIIKLFYYMYYKGKENLTNWG